MNNNKYILILLFYSIHVSNFKSATFSQFNLYNIFEDFVTDKNN